MAPKTPNSILLDGACYNKHFFVFQSAVNDIAWSKKHAAIFVCINDSSLEIWNLETST